MCKQTTAFHNRNKKRTKETFDEEAKRSFSVITHHGTLDFIASNEYEREIWVRVLTLLQPNAQGVDGDASIDKFAMYVEEQWKRADMDRDGSLSVDECVMLLRKMNYDVARKEIKSRMQGKSELSSNEFQGFMKEMMGKRVEISQLIKDIKQRYASSLSKSANRGPKNESEDLSMDELLFFLNTMQRMPRENQVTREEVIDTYFKGDRISDSITVIHFAKVLDHSRNSVIDPVSTLPGCGGKVLLHLTCHPPPLPATTCSLIASLVRSSAPHAAGRHASCSAVGGARPLAARSPPAARARARSSRPTCRCR